MSSSPVKRRLAAILSVDVVNYSAMMGADEEGTLRMLGAHRNLIDAAIKRHAGRIANTAGDSVLAEFSSPVEAVRAAIELQSGIEARNRNLPQARQMQLRAGVHLDDVIVQDNGDLLGEGVNIAARLQAAADPGSVLVSGEIVGQSRAKLPEYGFEKRGQPVMKNIVRTVEAFRVVAGAGARQVERADVASAPGARSAPQQKKSSRSTVIALAVGFGLLGGATLAWGLFAVLSSDRASQAKTDAEAETRRKAAAAEAAKQKAIEEERARRTAAAEEEARRIAAQQEEARRKSAEADAARRQAEAERQRQEQEAPERRRARAKMTLSLVWSDIDCARSRILALPGMTCNTSGEYTGVDGSGKFKRWAAGSHSAAGATYAMLVEGSEPTSVHFRIRREEESEFLIEISNFTRNNAENWSSLVDYGGGYYAQFRAGDGRACFAFVKPGPVRGDGLAWAMRGYHCVAGRQALTPERIAGVIDSLKSR